MAAWNHEERVPQDEGRIDAAHSGRCKTEILDHLRPGYGQNRPVKVAEHAKGKQQSNDGQPRRVQAPCIRSRGFSHLIWSCQLEPLAMAAHREPAWLLVPGTAVA